MDRIRVGVNGYGVIGKRVADAVHAQPDMHLVGVADIVTDWRIQSAVPRLPVFAATPDAHSGMVDTGIRPEGTLDDLLAQSDVIVDTTPKHVAAGNLPRLPGGGSKGDRAGRGSALDHRALLRRPGQLRHRARPGPDPGGVLQHHQHRPRPRRARKRRAAAARPRGYW